MTGCKGILIFLILSLSSCLPLLWPLPKSLNQNPNSTALTISPCQIKYNITSPILDYVSAIVDFYLDNVFQCSSKVAKNYTLSILVRSGNMTLPTQTGPEAYSLIIRESGRWELTSDYYSGFLRGIQTFSQLFLQQQDGRYIIEGIPIVIDDAPEFKWRGLMIDSSRHFLPVSAIKKTIDGLLFNKMNILHWHIIDQDSFPLVIPSVPELNQYGKVGGSYSLAEVKEVVRYAKLKGVRVIVEIDTPAHTHSWGRSDKYHENIVRCNNEYTGQFDPTLDSTYQLVNEVMKYINSTFQDPYVHFGGDEVVAICWDLKPSIRVWMIKHRIQTYRQLEQNYRKKQKELWRKISSNKKAIYWTNNLLNLPLENDDVLHWWGESKDVHKLAGKPNEVILSTGDITYIDKGFGNRNGGSYGHYIKWRDIYHFNPKVKDVKVIGGQTCIWSELSNVHTLEQKVWIRTSVLAQRLWNDGVDIKTELQSIAGRLQAQAERMRARGFKVSPVTVQMCEEDVSACFS